MAHVKVQRMYNALLLLFLLLLLFVVVLVGGGGGGVGVVEGGERLCGLIWGNACVG